MKRMIRSQSSLMQEHPDWFAHVDDPRTWSAERIAREEELRKAREAADEEDYWDLTHGEGQYEEFGPTEVYDSTDITAETSTRDRISNLKMRIEDLELIINELKATGADPEEWIDYELELQELEDELNFAWQDDEAEWNYAREQQEFNPDGSLKWY